MTHISTLAVAPNRATQPDPSDPHHDSHPRNLPVTGSEERYQPRFAGSSTSNYASRNESECSAQYTTGTARPRVSVIIPTLNEARNLPHVFAELPDDLHEVIVVDGFSTDGTPEVARSLRADTRIIHQDMKGKGDALRCGFEVATGDIIVMLDADGSADPAEIPAFVAALTAGADFAKGTRFRHGGGSADITRLRRTGNKALNGFVNMLFGTSYSDLCYGYNAFWQHCLGAMAIDCTGFEVETLINIRIARAGLAVQEVPSFERDRIHGASNLRTFRDGGRVFRTILRERCRRPRPHHGSSDRRRHIELALVTDEARPVRFAAGDGRPYRATLPKPRSS
jgi:glycosyltransferase involved in cell wall biosynthesis